MLEEGKDFILLTQKGEQGNKGFHGNLKAGSNAIDYILTLDTAKHIAMMSRGKKAKEVRDYFIAVEKKWREGYGANSQLFQAQNTLIVDLVKKLEAKHEALLVAKDETIKVQRSVIDHQHSTMMENQAMILSIMDRFVQHSTQIPIEHKFTQEEKEHMEAAKSKGYSTNAIASMMGRSPWQVRRYLEKLELGDIPSVLTGERLP